jgi:hypothetical protein
MYIAVEITKELFGQDESTEGDPCSDMRSNTGSDSDMRRIVSNAVSFARADSGAAGSGSRMVTAARC